MKAIALIRISYSNRAYTGGLQLVNVSYINAVRLCPVLVHSCQPLESILLYQYDLPAVDRLR